MSNQNMIRSTAMALCLLVTFTQCSSDDDGSSAKLNPKYRLSLALAPAWVRTHIGDGELSIYVRIDKGTYDNNIIYVVSSCCPYCNTITTYYDKNGNEIVLTSKVAISYEKIIYRGTGCEQIIID